VDRLLAGYNLALAVVWAALAGKTWYALWIGAAHAAAATLPWLLARSTERVSRPVRVLREIYPLLWLLGFWSELGLVRTLLHAGAHDELIRAVDLAVFGVHIHRIWMPAMPAVWLSEIMHVLYFAYYPLIFLPPIVAGLRGRSAAQRDMTFRLLLTYVGCYVLYLAFPVDGPSHTMLRYAGDLTDGFFYRLVHDAVEMGDSLGTAFPSSHVAGAVTIAILGWRWFGRGVAALLTIEAAGVLVSTVYTQNHYTVDAVAGLVLALALQLAVAPLLARALSGAPRRAPGGRPRALAPAPQVARTSAGVS
jgi:membrane-associated phospholipid phosphatase